METINSILIEIRDDARRHSQEMKERLEDAEQSQQRSELQMTLRELAQLSRGIKTALETRSATDARFEDHERRLAALESASE